MTNDELIKGLQLLEDCIDFDEITDGVNEYDVHMIIYKVITSLKTGHWDFADGAFGICSFKCSECAEIVEDVPTVMGEPIYGFCPYCGAHMGDQT